MDDALYLRKQDEWAKAFEALCLRCGECCGIKNDPCSNLAMTQDGKCICNVYDKRIGSQKTISGKAFTCVPIGEVIKKGQPNRSCGYMMPKMP